MQNYYTIIVTDFLTFGGIANSNRPIMFKPSTDYNYDIYAVFKFREDELNDIRNNSKAIKILHCADWKKE